MDFNITLVVNEEHEEGLIRCDHCRNIMLPELQTVKFSTMPVRHACQHSCAVEVISKLLKREMLSEGFPVDEPPALRVLIGGKQAVPFVQPELPRR